MSVPTPCPSFKSFSLVRGCELIVCIHPYKVVSVSVCKNGDGKLDCDSMRADC